MSDPRGPEAVPGASGLVQRGRQPPESGPSDSLAEGPSNTHRSLLLPGERELCGATAGKEKFEIHVLVHAHETPHLNNCQQHPDPLYPTQWTPGLSTQVTHSTIPSLSATSLSPPVLLFPITLLHYAVTYTSSDPAHFGWKTCQFDTGTLILFTHSHTQLSHDTALGSMSASLTPRCLPVNSLTSLACG